MTKTFKLKKTRLLEMATFIAQTTMGQKVFNPKRGRQIYPTNVKIKEKILQIKVTSINRFKDEKNDVGHGSNQDIAELVNCNPNDVGLNMYIHVREGS